MVLAFLQQLVLECLEIGKHGPIADLVGCAVAEILLFRIAPDEGVELNVPQIVELGRFYHLDVLESQRNLLLLPQPLSLLLKGNVLAVLKLPLQVLFLHRARLRLVGLARAAEPMVELHGRLELVAD